MNKRKKETSLYEWPMANTQSEDAFGHTQQFYECQCKMKYIFFYVWIFVTKQKSRPSDNAIDTLCALNFHFFQEWKIQILSMCGITFQIFRWVLFGIYFVLMFPSFKVFC